MARYKPEQKPLEEGTFSNGKRWQIYEEFGFYCVYIAKRLKSVHDTVDYARGKIARLEKEGFTF